MFVQSISVTIQRWADQGYLHYKGVGGGIKFPEKKRYVITLEWPLTKTV